MQNITTRAVDFYFEIDKDLPHSKYWELQDTNFKYVDKKLQRMINNWDLEAQIVYTTTKADHISAVLIFELYTKNDQDAEKYLDRYMQRVIDSHKEAATYHWPLSRINAKAKVSA